jgi:hypothetical protein
VFRVQERTLKIVRLFGVNAFAYFLLLSKTVIFPEHTEGAMPGFVLSTQKAEAEGNLMLVNLLLRISCKKKKKTSWSESASELYRPSDRRLSAK